MKTFSAHEAGETAYKLRALAVAMGTYRVLIHAGKNSYTFLCIYRIK